MEKYFSITRVRRDSNFEMKTEHFHSFYEFYYLLSGSSKIFLNDKVYHVNAGDLIMIPKGEIHRTTYFSKGMHERIALCFDDNMIESLKRKTGEYAFAQCLLKRKLTVPVNKKNYIEELFEKLLLEKMNGDEFSMHLCQMYCEEIVIFVMRCQRNQQVDESVAEHYNQEMESAAAYISSHFSEPITLEHMANRYCMSNSYFSKRFKQITGFGFKEYLNMVRIRRACELLLNTEKNITEISAECGFMDSNYFGDAFRKIKKVSPREYRKGNMVKKKM